MTEEHKRLNSRSGRAGSEGCMRARPGRLEMGVAVRLPRIDAGHPDRGLNLRLREVVSRNGHSAADVAEATAHGGDRELLHSKLHLRVSGVDLPDRRPARRGGLRRTHVTLLIGFSP